MERESSQGRVGVEGRTPGLNLAGPGQRLGALLLDTFFLAIVLVFGAIVLGLIGFAPGFSWLDDLGLFILWAVWVLWHRDGARHGQSPGKQLVGLRVVGKGGTPPDYKLVLFRDWVLRGFVGFWVLDILLFSFLGEPWSFVAFGVYALAAIWCVWDRERQCLWDKLLGTYVVHA
ncbi:MAG: RDD family protein [Chloroflexi bacterium]|nr:RDD family protein [Chloroflexota bacterium]